MTMGRNKKTYFVVISSLVSIGCLFFGWQIFSQASAGKKEVAVKTEETTTSKITVSESIKELSSSKKEKKKTEETASSELVELEETSTTVENITTDPVKVDKQIEASVEETTTIAVEEKAVEPDVKEEAAISYSPNTIGINGIFQSFLSLGSEKDLDVIQSYIDGGNIVTTISNFNPHDNQTTYFGGHNPGIMGFMSDYLAMGAVVTVVDGSGTPYCYQASDYAMVDVYGKSTLGTIGMSAIDLFVSGSFRESIAIQYCVSGSETMIMWYLTPLF